MRTNTLKIKKGNDIFNRNDFVEYDKAIEEVTRLEMLLDQAHSRALYYAARVYRPKNS